MEDQTIKRADERIGNEEVIIEKMKLLQNGRQKLGLENGVGHARKKYKNNRSNVENGGELKRTKQTKKNLNDLQDDKVKARSDSPGLDLSIFQPRSKRKCVIQNEVKRGKEEEVWWSEEDDRDEIEEQQEDDEDHKETRGRKTKTRKSRKKADVSETKKTEEEASVTTTYRCYVFSTAMANRAGNAVDKEQYKSIGDYHASQSWDTPYLNPEVHCRPFLLKFEEEEESAMEGGKERTLSVESWEKEKVIEAAKKMSRMNNSIIKSTSDEAATLQTVPKLIESSVVVCSKDENPRKNSAFTEVKPTTVINSERKSEDTSPPQLVPTFKIASYPADVTNVKEQLSYRAPRLHQRTEESVNGCRPSVLNMTPHDSSMDTVRSSLDVAEKALKEARMIPAFLARPHLHYQGKYSPPTSLHLSPHEHLMQRMPYHQHSPNAYRPPSVVTERPSSLPMSLSTHHLEKKPPKSFSVESLTTKGQPHRNELYHDTNERMRLTNGFNIHGLKRSLDERIIERAHHDKKLIIDKERLLSDKERYLYEKERYACESERFAYEKDRLLHHGFTDPRLRLPFLPRSLPSESHPAFLHLHRPGMQQYSPQFPSR